LTSHKKPALAVVAFSGFYLLATSAFYPLDFLGVFDAKRVLQLVLFAAILVFAVAWAPLRTATVAQLNRLSRLNRYLLGLFFLIGLVSSLRLDHPAYPLVDVSMMFVMMVLIAVMAASRDLSGASFDKWAALLLAAVGFAVVLQELMGFVVGWLIGTEFSYDKALIHFAHPRFYNHLQTWSISLLGALPLLFPEKRWVRIGSVLLIGLQWFLVIALAARGTAVSLLIAMSFIALWLPGQRKFWMKFQLAGLLVGIVIYAGVVFLNGMLIPKTQPGQQSEFYAYSLGRPMVHTSGRSIFWRLSLQDAINHPILGSGPTRFACDSKLILPAHAHSFPMGILGEWGMISFTLFLIIAITIGIGLLKNVKWQSEYSLTDPPLKAMLTSSLIAGAIHACLSGVMIMPASQVAMIIIGGWSLSLSQTSREEIRFPSLAKGMIFTAMLMAIVILVFAIAEITTPVERDINSDPHHPRAPRFWQDGKACGEKQSLLFE